jgi:hypothetical protein
VLHAITALRPVEPPRQNGRSGPRGAFDVRTFLAAHDVTITQEKPWQGLKGNGTFLELAACIFDASHDRGEAGVIVLESGMLLYKCQHNSCAEKTWPDVRELLEPARAQERHRRPGVGSAEADPTPSAPPRISRRLSTILADPAALEPPVVVVPRLAWRGRTTLLAAREKAGKSTMATAAAAAVTRKALWLGDPTPRGVVLWVALEEHVSDVASRLNEWKADAECVYVIDSLAGVEDPMGALHGETRTVAPTLVVVDTLSAFVDAIGSRPDPGSSTAWTPIMTGLTRIARDTDAAVLIVHHARRSDGAYRDSSAIGAGVDAIVEMADGPDADVRALRIRARWREGDYSVRLVGTEYKFASGELSLDARVLLHVKGHPGCSQREVRDGVGSRTRDVVAAVRRLLESGAMEDRGTEAGMRLYLSEASVSRDVISDPPGNTLGTTPGSGNFPVGTKAEPLSGTTAVPDSKPLGGGSGNTPDMWGDV